MVAIAPFIAAVFAPFIQRVIGSATGWLLALVPAAIFAYLTSFISSIAAGQPIHARIAWIPAYGIDLSLGQQFAMLGLLMITSKGIAGVPRASLVVIAATLPYFNIPEAGLLLVLAVDHFLDMGRSATNVIGNAVATAVVAKWDAADAEVTSPATVH